MKRCIYIFSLVLGWIFISCETPFTPKVSKEEDIFTLSHDIESTGRIIQKRPITLSWPEVTIDDFAQYTIYRSTLIGENEVWREREEITNPLQVSYVDTIDDDETYRYKVRIEDASGNYREAKTEQLIFRTTSFIFPDEYWFLQQAYDSPFIDNGDTIYVNPGTYEDTLVAIDKDVSVIGIGDAEETILQRGGNIVSMNRGTLTGFTIKIGWVELSGTALMSNCIITDVSTSGFPGAVMVSDSAEVQYCDISGNQKTNQGGIGGDGAGVVLRDYAAIRNCRITENETTEEGGGISVYGEPTIMNCIIDNNYAEKGGGGLNINPGSEPMVVNCVIFKNQSGRYGEFGAVLGGEYALTTINSIVWRNSSYGNEMKIWFNSSYSDIQGYIYGTGNISSTPQFVDPSSGDFHLIPGSPCIDAGHPGEEYLDTDGTRNDMGAYGGPFGNW